MRIGFDAMPLELLKVWCRGCHRPAGLWCAAASGAGAWHKDHRRRCRCDPPPQLPEGAELDREVARAWRSKRKGGKLPMNISR
jgi:hypothetical protein